MTAWILFRNDVNGSVDESYSGDNVVLLYIPTFLIGALVGVSVMDAIEESIATTLYACFAEEPEALELVDGELYLDLMDTWTQSLEDEADGDDDDMYDGDESISDFEFDEDPVIETPPRKSKVKSNV